MSDVKRKKAAAQFADEWAGKGYEKGESQPFWLALLRDVFGVEKPESYIKFESKVVITTPVLLTALLLKPMY